MAFLDPGPLTARAYRRSAASASASACPKHQVAADAKHQGRYPGAALLCNLLGEWICHFGNSCLLSAGDDRVVAGCLRIASVCMSSVAIEMFVSKKVHVDSCEVFHGLFEQLICFDRVD